MSAELPDCPQARWQSPQTVRDTLSQGTRGRLVLDSPVLPRLSVEAPALGQPRGNGPAWSASLGHHLGLRLGHRLQHWVRCADSSGLCASGWRGSILPALCKSPVFPDPLHVTACPECAASLGFPLGIRDQARSHPPLLVHPFSLPSGSLENLHDDAGEGRGPETFPHTLGLDSPLRPPKGLGFWMSQQGGGCRTSPSS